MNYREQYAAIAENLVALEQFFHALFNIDISAARPHRTGIRRLQVLRVLGRGDHHLTHLCDRLGMRTNSCSELLDRMSRDGLVDRRPGIDDRRKVYYRLTETGRKRRRELEEMNSRQVAKICSSMSPRELQSFSSCIAEIAEIADNVMEKRSHDEH